MPELVNVHVHVHVDGMRRASKGAQDVQLIPRGSAPCAFSAQASPDAPATSRCLEASQAPRRLPRGRGRRRDRGRCRRLLAVCLRRKKWTSTALDRASALSARIGGAVPRGNSILLEQLKRAGSRQGSSGADRLHADQDVKMSRCENSLTSTSTACDGHLRAHQRITPVF